MKSNKLNLFFKTIIPLLVMFCATVSQKINAQSSANKNDIMLQAFGWDVHTQPTITAEGGLYNFLKNRTSDYAANGFNVVWLPPPSKSTGGVGYIPTELFNFSQTVYGSEAQLRALLTAMNTSTPQIHPMADIVVNHRGGSTNWTDFTNPTWDCKSITSNDEANFVTITGNRPCGNADTGEDFNGARDLDHTNLQVQNGVKEYLTRLKGLGFDSWRWDVAKGFSASYFGDYINSSSPYASVGEYWDGSTSALKSWIDGTGKKSAAFDFSLYYSALQPAMNSGNYAALAGNPGLAGQFGYADKAVTFIDNHDTFVKQGSFVSNDNIMKGYAFILTNPGIPCVFFPHYYGGTYKKDGVTVTYSANKTAIDKLMAVRKSNGINAYSSVVVSNSGSFYSAIIDNKVAVKIGSSQWNPGAGWILKTSGTDYAVWDKGVATDTPSLNITPLGGNFNTGNTVNVVLTANNSTSTIYYTLDGSTPTAASTSAVGTKTLAITNDKTLKAFVKNTSNVSSTISTEEYTFSTPETFTVYFKKPTNWNSAVKIYYWETTGTATAATWPGIAMTADCGDWYKYTFPSTVSASKLLFTDGTLKTVDLTANAGIKYYDNAWLTGEPTNRCPSTAPTLSITPNGGAFTTGATVNVVLTANVNTSTIYYTIDGSTPTTTSASAVGTKTIPVTSTTVLKAFVKNTSNVSSTISTEEYTFSAPETFTVYFKKPSNWNSAVKIYYWSPTGTATAVTWPGIAMTADCGNWYKYTFPSTVSASKLLFNDGTLKTADLTANAGIKYYDNAWLTGEPTDRCPVIAPTLSIAPTGGSFTTGTTVNVVLTANVNTSTIHYTLDGSTPTTASASAIGTKTIAVTSTTTLKAFVKNTSNVSSTISTEEYSFSTPETFTVYFKKPSNWNSAVKIYYWGTTGTTPAVTWPGVAMTSDCGSWYKFTFPSTVSASKIVFNDGTLQTDDLNATAGVKYYDNAWLTGEPTDRCPTVSSVTVYFKPPTSWTSAPKVYYWGALPAASIANSSWPGKTMVADADGFYKYTIVGPTSVNVIFNNGSGGSNNQTADLLAKVDGYSYTWGANARIAKSEESDLTNVSVFPNPVMDVLQINTESNVLKYKIVSAQGIVLKEGNAVENAVDVSSLNAGLYFIQLTLENGQEQIKRIIKK